MDHGRGGSVPVECKMVPTMLRLSVAGLKVPATNGCGNWPQVADATGHHHVFRQFNQSSQMRSSAVTSICDLDDPARTCGSQAGSAG
jgi:hypothetical protein